MKNLVLAIACSLMLPAFATAAVTVPSSDVQLAPSQIEKVIRLVDKKTPGQSHKKLQVVVIDNGMSTDVSPRYTVYLGYASLAEMGNMSVDFKINDQALEFLSASRKSAGIYEIKTTEYRDNGLYEVTQVVDATKMFADENKMRKNCGSDFCDEKLNTSVSVTTTLKQIK